MSFRKSLLSAVILVLFVAAEPAPHRADWKEVAEALGRAGAMQPGDVYKVSFPRGDLSVTADGVAIKPALALGSWIAFRQTANGHAMAMGDLVLLESEINPVIDVLQAGGIEQSALHNHLIGETPHVMYLHVSGHGDAAKLAATIRAALAVTKTPTGTPATPSPSPLDLPAADLDRLLGYAGKANGGVDQFSIPRAETITEHGDEVPASMGTATAINVQPTGGGRAAISGDFVMTAAEVNPVIRALRAGGIKVTAVHSHMLDETPRLFFMHFWANDDALKLAATLRSALDRMHVKK
ncbi:MAG: hypothetical protein QOE82_1995 [Thermoanaerobaculia bacterium]|jgi:hypothetical protein|nr:hypothetical protein [Thermoanaerobaculia bacterium]